MIKINCCAVASTVVCRVEVFRYYVDSLNVRLRKRLHILVFEDNGHIV